MIALSSGARVWLATGHTDMRKGYQSLALLVQETLKRDPHGGHLFVFRGRRGDLIKCLWHDSEYRENTVEGRRPFHNWPLLTGSTMGRAGSSTGQK